MPYIVLLKRYRQKGPKKAILLLHLDFFDWLYFGDRLLDPFQMLHAYGDM